MMDLLVFRMQSAAAKFFRNHPAKIGVGIALLMGAVMAGGLFGAIHFSRMLTPSFGWQMAIIVPVVCVGAYVAFEVSERYIRMIDHQEQHAMIAKFPPGVVSTDRRLSKLEAYLINQTQGPERQAWAAQRVLDRGTQAASAVRSSRRL